MYAVTLCIGNDTACQLSAFWYVHAGMQPKSSTKSDIWGSK